MGVRDMKNHKLMKITSWILTFILAINFISFSNIMNVHAESKSVQDFSNNEEIIFEENNETIKMVIIRSYGAVSKIDVFRDNIFDETINIRTEEECKASLVDTINVSLTRAYENRTFSGNTLVLQQPGNTEIDNISQITIVSALWKLVGYMYAPAEKVADAAALISGALIAYGYATGDRVNLNYTMYKYWANTIDGYEPVIYRTRFNYYFSTINTTDVYDHFTYNNPI